MLVSIVQCKSREIFTAARMASRWDFVLFRLLRGLELILKGRVWKEVIADAFCDVHLPTDSQ